MSALLLSATRPRQWSKNFLVFIAGLTSGDAFKLGVWPKLLLAFWLYTFASASMYLVNDVRDKKVDASHPKKKFRAIASGQLSSRTALFAAAALSSISIVGVVALPKKAFFILAGYLLITVIYSLKLKSIRIIEIVIVSSGFVLRIWFGAAAINVPMSAWLCVSIYAGSAMIVIAKRHAELRIHDPKIVREVILKYSRRTLRVSGLFASLCLITTYVLWTLFGQQDTLTDRLFLYISCIPFVVGVVKFYSQDQIHGVEEPEEFLLSDKTMQISGASFLLLLALGIFVNR